MSIILTDLSVHFPTILSINIDKTVVNDTPLYKTVRPMPIEKKQAFCIALFNFNWHDVLMKNDVDSAVDLFFRMFFDFFDYHFQTKRIKKNKKNTWTAQ